MATITVPGRTELAGNHTDHQLGRILASAIHLNIQAVFTTSSSPVVRLRSEHYDPIEVRLNQFFRKQKKVYR